MATTTKTTTKMTATTTTFDSSTTRNEISTKENRTKFFSLTETERFRWQQSTTDVEVFMKIPRDTKKRDIEVVLKNDYLSVKLKGSNWGNRETLCEGYLFRGIKASESVWTIAERSDFGTYGSSGRRGTNGFGTAAAVLSAGTARDRSGANNRRRFVRRGRLRRDGKCATARHKLIRAAHAEYNKYIKSALRREY